MSLSRPLNLSAMLLGLSLLTSCSIEQQYNQYQTPSSQTQKSQGAVAELHLHAIEALRQQSYQQAIELLQRAIRIEPRDAHSWHYLAQAYWYRGDRMRCLEMLDRSMSYSSSDDDLEFANQRLREQCQPI